MSDYNPFALVGKTVLVTGASSGIGQATAIEAARLGAKVVITGRNADRLQQTFGQLEGSGHLMVTADLTCPDDLNRLVGQSPELNGLVLCAGVGLTLPFNFCTREKFNEMFEVNYFAPVEFLRLLSRKKKILKAGSVVFIASIGGTTGFSNGNAIYGATKAGIVSTMKFCAIEMAPRNVRVNAVSPGMVETPLIHRTNRTEEELAKDMARYPLRRYGRPEDIAHGVVYLLSDASSWVTGHSLVIDGGVTI